MTASFECPDCEKRFPSPRALAAHQRAHDVEPMSCPMCGKAVRYLVNHVKRHVDREGLTSVLRILLDHS